VGLPRARRIPAAVAVSVAAVIAPPAFSAPVQAQAAGSSFTRAVAGLGLEQWTTQSPAPGVSVSSVTITNPSTPVWTVTLEEPVDSPLNGSGAAEEVEAPADAQTISGQLSVDGFVPRVEAVQWPDYADTPHGLMGDRVRVGEYATQAAAQTEAAVIAADGFRDIVEWTGYDAQTPADLENIHVAVVDPRKFTGSVEATHDGQVGQRQTTSAVAAQLDSLVGTNGGFFATADSEGFQGTQSGLGAYDGRLESMSSGARAALLIQDHGRSFRVANLASTASISAGSSSYPIQGINRVPGVLPDCGRPDAVPTAHPEQDVTCSEANDLVLFTPELGAALPTGAGVQAVLDSAGAVVSVGSPGGTVPAGGSVVQGIGTAAAWLAAHAIVGATLHVSEQVRDVTTGQVICLAPDDSIVSAAPVLVRNGRIDIDAATEGTVDPQDLSFGFQWANVRQPRTIAGVTARGDLVLVTVDGRLADGSEGFTLAEEAEFMRSLGVIDALNLDGGGSTEMAVNGQLVNDPSGGTVRAVGDTVQVLP
jgi:exopolysaccharide biosynthesis protein